MDDDDLIARIRAGDENAVETLIERYYAPILRYCYRKTSNRETAEDLTQETFYRAFKNLAQYRRRGGFRAWLYRIAKHGCADEYRKPRVEICTLDEELEAGEENAQIARFVEHDELKRLLQTLSEEQREAILLHFEEELTFREIGQLLGIPARTAQSRVNTGLKRLKKEADR